MNMEEKQTKIRVVIFFCLFNLIYGGDDQRRLLKHLFIDQEHNPLERPVTNDSESLSVEINFSLIKIVDCDIDNQVFIVNLWITQKWNDYSTTWKPEDYGNITSIVLPSTKIWLPDIVLYNNVDQNIDEQMRVNAVIQSNGDVLYVTPKILKSSCSFNNLFPSSDVKHCSLKFGSWSYDKSKINLRTWSNVTDVSSYVINNRWLLINAFTQHLEVEYECCPEIYPSVTLNIKIRQRSSHLFTNNNRTDQEDD